MSQIATDRLRFFVQYHNYDNLGYLPGDYQTDEADLSTLDTSSFVPSCISSRRGFIRDTVGNVIFLIVGYGVTPKCYILWSWSRIDEVRPGENGELHAEGSSGGVLNSPACLSGKDFERFKHWMGNFRRGFSEITDHPFLARLIKLAKRWGNFKLEPQLAEPAPDDEDDPTPPAVPDRVWRAIQERRGRSTFRQKLLGAYGGRCAVTRCDAEAVLEAAQIRRYAETGSQDVIDGLLLRADIHTLFDLGLVRIHPEALRVELAEELRNTSYGELQGRRVRMPNQAAQRPSKEALRDRWEEAERLETPRR